MATGSEVTALPLTVSPPVYAASASACEPAAWPLRRSHPAARWGCRWSGHGCCGLFLSIFIDAGGGGRGSATVVVGHVHVSLVAGRFRLRRRVGLRQRAQ